ncbi:hypothetical protein TruAng_002603 [Truncatella angustata]|nr:hypothetical protein TruAng_002603 [Truncatella angustata]
MAAPSAGATVELHDYPTDFTALLEGTRNNGVTSVAVVKPEIEPAVCFKPVRLELPYQRNSQSMVRPGRHLFRQASSAAEQPRFEPRWQDLAKLELEDQLEEDIQTSLNLPSPLETGWQDLSHVAQSIIFKELTDRGGSFQLACRMLLLFSAQVEKWIRIYRAERDQKIRWDMKLVQWQLHAPESWESDLLSGGPVEMQLLTTGEMYKAANFVKSFGYHRIADRIKAWSHKKVTWPFTIDISSYRPHEIQDGNTGSINADTDIQDSATHTDESKDQDEEKEEEDQEETSVDSVRALFSIGLTCPQIKVKNSIRLLTSILPRGTVVIGPSGRQVLSQAGEYRVCPPRQYNTPIEAESQLDFVTDDTTWTSIFHEEYPTQISTKTGIIDDNHDPFATDNIDDNELYPCNLQKDSTNVASQDHAVATTDYLVDNVPEGNDDPLGHSRELVHISHNMKNELYIGTGSSVKKSSTSEAVMASTLTRLADAMTMSDFPWQADHAKEFQVSHLPDSDLFRDAITTYELSSPRLPTQVIPVNKCSSAKQGDSTLFDLINAHANRMHVNKQQSRKDPSNQMFYAPVKPESLQATIAGTKPELMLQDGLSAAFPDTSPAERRQRQWDQIFHAWRHRFVLLNPARNIKDAPTVGPDEFEPYVREALPEGSRPDNNVVGPVEKITVPTIADDQSDLAFMTLPLPPNYAVVSPSGYIMNFDTAHRGPIDGKAPLGRGGIYSFLLPEMAEHLPEHFKPSLPDWIGFRIFLPQQTGLVLDGKWLSRWATMGMHQIAEIDGELDLINDDGRYRTFNQMEAIGTPIKKNARDSDLANAVLREADRILIPYKRQLQLDQERERAEEEMQVDTDHISSKRIQDKLTKKRETDHLRRLAADKKKERQTAKEGGDQREARPLGRGSRATRPAVNYVDDLLDDIVSDDATNEEFWLQDDPDDDVFEVQGPEAESLIVAIRTPQRNSQTEAQAVKSLFATERSRPIKKARKIVPKTNLPGVTAHTIKVAGTDETSSEVPQGLRVTQSLPSQSGPEFAQSYQPSDEEPIYSQLPALVSKRSASLISGINNEGAASEMPAKRRRGRPRKNGSELARPSKKQGTRVLGTGASSLAPAPDPKAIQKTVTPVPVPNFVQQTKLPSSWSIAPPADMDQPTKESSQLDSADLSQKLDPKIITKPASSGGQKSAKLPRDITKNPLMNSDPQSAALKQHSSSPAKAADLPEQPTGSKPAVKILPKPKYELKSARKANRREESLSPKRASTFVSRSLMQEEPEEKRQQASKPKTERITTPVAERTPDRNTTVYDSTAALLTTPVTSQQPSRPSTFSRFQTPKLDFASVNSPSPSGAPEYTHNPMKATHSPLIRKSSALSFHASLPPRPPPSNHTAAITDLASPTTPKGTPSA